MLYKLFSIFLNRHYIYTYMLWFIEPKLFIIHERSFLIHIIVCIWKQHTTSKIVLVMQPNHAFISLVICRIYTYTLRVSKFIHLLRSWVKYTYQYWILLRTSIKSILHHTGYGICGSLANISISIFLFKIYISKSLPLQVSASREESQDLLK